MYYLSLITFSNHQIWLIAIGFSKTDFSPLRITYSILAMSLSGLEGQVAIELMDSYLIALSVNITIDISYQFEFIEEAMLTMASACYQHEAMAIAAATAKEPQNMLGFDL